MSCHPSRMTRGIQAIMAVFLLSTSVAAQPGSEQAQASPLPGSVNVGASRVYTFVDKSGLGHQHAVEGRLKSGSLSIGAESAAGKLVFDMNSFDADTDRARKYVGLSGATDAATRAKVNANLKGKGVLHVHRHPTATFVVSSASPTGKNGKRGLPTFELQGNFTLHGVTRPLVVIADVEQANGWLHVRGSFVIKQTAFGIAPFSKLFGAIAVADALRIYGDLWVAPTEAIALRQIPLRE